MSEDFRTQKMGMEHSAFHLACLAELWLLLFASLGMMYIMNGGNGKPQTIAV